MRFEHLDLDEPESMPHLKTAQLITLLLLCLVAVSASYVESRYPSLPNLRASALPKP